MRPISRHLTRILNVWLIFTLITGILPPFPQATAASNDSNPTTWSLEPRSQFLTGSESNTRVADMVDTEPILAKATTLVPRTFTLPFNFSPGIALKSNQLPGVTPTPTAFAAIPIEPENYPQTVPDLSPSTLEPASWINRGGDFDTRGLGIATTTDGEHLYGVNRVQAGFSYYYEILRYDPDNPPAQLITNVDQNLRPNLVWFKGYLYAYRYQPIDSQNPDPKVQIYRSTGYTDSWQLVYDQVPGSGVPDLPTGILIPSKDQLIFYAPESGTGDNQGWQGNMVLYSNDGQQWQTGTLNTFDLSYNHILQGHTIGSQYGKESIYDLYAQFKTFTQDVPSAYHIFKWTGNGFSLVTSNIDTSAYSYGFGDNKFHWRQGPGGVQYSVIPPTNWSGGWTSADPTITPVWQINMPYPTGYKKVGTKLRLYYWINGNWNAGEDVVDMGSTPDYWDILKVIRLDNGKVFAYATWRFNDVGGVPVTYDYWYERGAPISNDGLPPDQTLSPKECPICSNGDLAHYPGGPINTSTGNYNYEVTDLSVSTVGQPLKFERAYNSLPVTGTVIYSRPLGYGWTHNYDINLTFSGAPGGEDGTVILKAPHGSRMRFTDNGDGTYTPYPGIWANMTRQGTTPPYTYVITAANQTLYTFVGSTLYTSPITSTSRITASDGAANDVLGYSVAVDGDYAIVGAPGDDDKGDGAGAAYIFIRNGTSWTQQAKLTASDGAAQDEFGWSVAISDTTAIIGANSDDSSGDNAGSVYVFVRNGTVWTQQAELVANDATRDAHFGSSVALSGNTAVIGAENADGPATHSGAAYIFARSGTNWNQQAKLTASDGVSYVKFGNSVALSGDTAIIGAPGDNTSTGSAYVFLRSETSWAQQAKLVANDGAIYDSFGCSVSISKDTTIIGALADTIGANTSQGSAYIFSRSATTWSQQAKLTASDGAAYDLFGTSVAISGNTALVGAYLTGTAGDTGSVYVFRHTGANWNQYHELSGTNWADTYYLGISVALSGDTALVGADLSGSSSIPASGAAVTFKIVQPSDETRLVSIRDSQGNLTNLTYANGISLTRATDAGSGRYLDFGYDSQGRLTSVTDHFGRTTGYGYDAINNLTVFTDTRSLAWTYSYTTAGGAAGTPHYLHAITDPDGKVVERTFFNPLGRAIRQENGLGQPVAEISYLGNTSLITVAGKVMTDTYNAQGLWVGQQDATGQQTFGFDDSFNRTSVADANGNPPTQYQRDAFGLTHMITDALGFTTTFSYDARNNLTQTVDARGNATTYVYDTQNNLKQVINPASVGGTTVYTYNTAGQVTAVRDENGNLTQYAYDSLGNRTVITDGLGSVTRYGYDSLGRVITTTDPLNKVTVNTYDNANNLIKVTENYLVGQPQNYQSEYNLITQYAYDGANRQTVITDTLGRVTLNIYDGAGRLSQTIENKHASVSTQNYLNEYNLTTTYGYDTFGRQTAITDTLGHVNRTVYDNAGRVQRTIANFEDGNYSSSAPDKDIITELVYDANGNVTQTKLLPGSSEEQVTCTTYDELNRVEKTVENCLDGNHSGDPPDVDLVTTYGYDAVGNQRVITNTRGYPTFYDYDALNRVITITNPLGDPTSYGYDLAGNRTRLTDAKGQTTTYAYDALNRVVTTTNDLGFSTVVNYDVVGNRIRLTDANDNPLNYTYDNLYRLKTLTNTENQTTSFTYDALGNKKTQTDAETRVTLYEYDSLNRLITTTQNYDSGGPVNEETNVKTTVAYDALGRQTQTTDARGNSTTYGYDLLGRTVAITDALGHATRTSYDGLGNRRSMTNGENETIQFEYDGVNRLVLVRDHLGHETKYGYDEAGNRVQMTDANEVVTRYEYDPLDRLIKVTENYVSGGPTDNVTNLATRYGYDQVGNRTAITDARTITTTTYVSTFVYDRLNRRTDMYDQVGHRTQYSYDKVGNQKVITDANLVVTSFTYDKVNRLTAINYSDATPDVSFTYDNIGNRETMTDGTGTTTYTYDALYRLKSVVNGANQLVNYGYDAAGNRTRLTYPNATQVVTYTYDAANRLDGVTDWNNGQFGYDYDNANRLVGLSLPNAITSAYTYDDAGRLTLLTHTAPTQTLASYAYGLDKVGNRTALTETLIAVQYLAAGAYLESEGQVVMEAENGQAVSGLTRDWLTATAQSGYTGTAYLQALPDNDILYSTDALTSSPVISYPINFTTSGTYAVWLRGYPTNAAGDSVYVGLGSQLITMTGFVPGQWSWATKVTPSGLTATLSVTTSGLYTVNVWMREDGLRLDRLLLTTSTTFIPTNFGPAESARQMGTGGPTTPLTHTITYTYDNLYRLTNANYNTGETYAYSYDPVGNRLQQIINDNTTGYQYDAANRLAAINGQSNIFDANGNLKQMGVMSNTFDAANRLITTSRATTTLQVTYNGLGDRVAQTIGATTTQLALDVQGLPEVIYTSSGESYLHLPGVIMTQNSSGQRRYLIGDGLGSIRQVVDETAQVVAYYEFDPYGNPVNNTIGGEPYGYTGEWYEGYINLLHLRARWYNVETGTFLSRDPVESEPPYLYVRGNPVNLTDPVGNCPPSICGSFGLSSEPDPRDLTDWLYREMVANAKDPAVRKLRWKNEFAKRLTEDIVCDYVEQAISIATLQGVDPAFIIREIAMERKLRLITTMAVHASALDQYKKLVEDGALWDHKDEIGIRLGPGITLCTSPGVCQNDVEYSVTGNIHFAYMGVVAGFPGWEIQGGAAFAEINDPGHDEKHPYSPPSWEEMIGSTPWDPSTLNFGDEARDHEAVTLGIKLAENYGDHMTSEQFRRELSKYINRLSTCTPDPAPVKEEVAKQWPYPVGYFNNQGRAYTAPLAGRCS